LKLGKNEYSNAPGGDCYAAMPSLWNKVNLSEYSIFIQRYKLNDQLTLSYKASNLIGDFIKFSESLRKDSFGVMQLVGEEEGSLEIIGAWIIKGNSIKAMAEVNPDTYNYDWEKITNLNDANKQKIADLFCSWETIDGKSILDCKILK